MKLGIMQPYFLPYIGYWQLMNAVDTYVIYDDVNFIKGGWINRNNLLLNGKAHLFTLPLTGVSSFKKINEIGILPCPATILKTIVQSYSKAPQFSQVYPLLESMLHYKSMNLATVLEHSITSVAGYLDMHPRFMISSEINKNTELRGQDKVLDICSILGATEYYNAIGGKELYDFAAFRDKGIRLSFLKTDSIQYKQFNHDFVPNLSVLDVLMFNSKASIHEMLKAYTLESM